ncbi:hypothetical protein OS493_037728, partial [Desmophyllum pertusum]
RAKGLARASAPSLRSLEGISVRPVDFLIFKVFGCARTKSSVMDINLKVTCLVIDLASGAWLAALLLVWLVSVSNHRPEAKNSPNLADIIIGCVATSLSNSRD